MKRGRGWGWGERERDVFELLNIVKILCVLYYSVYGGRERERGRGMERDGEGKKKGKARMDVGRVRGDETGCGGREGGRGEGGGTIVLGD